jgi:hypothetical protein
MLWRTCWIWLKKENVPNCSCWSEKIVRTHFWWYLVCIKHISAILLHFLKFAAFYSLMMENFIKISSITKLPPNCSWYAIISVETCFWWYLVDMRHQSVIWQHFLNFPKNPTFLKVQTCRIWKKKWKCSKLLLLVWNRWKNKFMVIFGVYQAHICNFASLSKISLSKIS